MSGSYFMLKFLRKKRRKLNEKVNQKKPIEQEYTNENEIPNNLNLTKCRVCLRDGNIPIYNQAQEFDMSEALHTYGGIELSEYDEYPKHLCKACHTFLQNAILFKKTAQETEKLLRETIHQKNAKDFIENNDNIEDYSSDYKETPKCHSCKPCKLIFNSWDEYLEHKTSKKHKNVRIQCSICNGLLTAHLFKRHLERHQSASHLICDICGKLYRKDNLVRHLQLHSHELPFQCQVCPYRGRFMESLKIHMRTHTGDKPFSCDKCELRFLTRSNLNRHLLTHKKERPFKCVECGRGFYTKRDMDVHFKADHAGIKDFGCRMCGNKYGTRKALMRHELRVHKRDKMAKGRVPLYLQAEYQKNEENIDENYN